MCVKFPKFALCDNDWKADYLATTHYPSWYSNHVRGVAIKEEAEEPVDVDANSDRPAWSKRPTAEQSTASEHKKRTKNVTICMITTI